MSYIRTAGLVLKREDQNDYDRWLTIYTEDYGKIQALARGAKRLPNKMAAHLEPFLINQLMLARGKGGHHLASALTVKNFSGLQNNLVKIAWGSCCLELADQSIKLEHSDPAIFYLLVKVFELLNPLTDELAMENLVHFFGWRLLILLGYQPELYCCLRCRQKLQPVGNCFSAAGGGLVCANCPRPADNEPISADAIKVLRLVAETGLANFSKLKLSGSLREEINRLIDQFVGYHLGQELRSRQYLASEELRITN